MCLSADRVLTWHRSILNKTWGGILRLYPVNKRMWTDSHTLLLALPFVGMSPNSVILSGNLTVFFFSGRTCPFMVVTFKQSGIRSFFMRMLIMQGPSQRRVGSKQGHSCTYCQSLLTIILRKNTSNRLVFIQRAASTQGVL